MRLALLLLIGSVAYGQTNTSFFDHFTGTSLNARWGTAVAGNGVVCVNGTIVAGSGGTCTTPTSGESVLNTVSAAVTDSAFIYKALDLTKTQIWRFSVNRVNAQTGGVMWVVNSASAPTSTAQATWDAAARLRITFNNSGTILEARKWDSSHTNTRWDSTNNTWSSGPTADFIPVTRTDSFHEVALEIDGPNAKWRLISFTREASGYGQKTNGYFQVSLTDWVTWASQETTASPYIVFGLPYNNSGTPTNKLEYISYSDGPVKEYLVNGENTGGTYRITAVRGIVGTNGVPDVIVPIDRTTVAIAAVGSTWESGGVKDPSVVLDSDGTYYAAYGGINSVFQIGIASASSMSGTWTKASNPRVSASAGTNENAVYNPFLFKDLDEPDPAKRWKLIYNGSDTSSPILARAYLRTCAGPPTTCTWSASTQILDVGSAAVGLTSSTCSRASNVVTCTTASAHGFIVGVPIYITGSTGCSTAINGTFYSIAGTTGSTIKFNQTASNETNCNTGGTVTTYDTNGIFRSHAYRVGGIWYSIWNPHNAAEPSNPTRISYATGGTLTNLAKSGRLLIDHAIGSPDLRCRTLITADVTASRVVTVADTTGCAADQVVSMDQDATDANGFVNRILSVDSSTQLTMYTKMDGLTASSNPLLESPVTSAYRDEEAHMEQVDPSTWVMLHTCFGMQQAGYGGSFILNSEWVCQARSTTGITGTYTPINLSSLTMTHNAFGNNASMENIAPIRPPIPAQPRPRVGRM